MKAPRIMIFTPAAPLPPYVHGETLKSISALKWGEPFEFILGREDKVRTPDRQEAYTNIAKKYEMARQMALAGGYDALLTLEADMIIPPDALKLMTQSEADVVYALYCSRLPAYKYNWLLVQERGSHGVKPESRNAQFRLEAWDKVIECAGHGLGCTLIRRHVLEALPFRCPDTRVANDWYFALDCQEWGFSQVHDCRVRCGHIITGNKVLWPDLEKTFHIQRLLER